jgi:hypothetical protein
MNEIVLWVGAMELAAEEWQARSRVRRHDTMESEAQATEIGYLANRYWSNQQNIG